MNGKEVFRWGHLTPVRPLWPSHHVLKCHMSFMLKKKKLKNEKWSASPKLVLQPPSGHLTYSLQVDPRLLR